jgi:hypothetical protein
VGGIDAKRLMPEVERARHSGVVAVGSGLHSVDRFLVDGRSGDSHNAPRAVRGANSDAERQTG